MVEMAADRDVMIRIERSNVTGTVIDAASRQPLADTAVALRHVAGGEIPEFLIAGSTDATGAFELPQVPPGRYLLHVTREGYSPYQGNLEVADGRALAGVEVPLEPAPGVELAVRLASGRIPPMLHLRVLSPAGELLLAESRPVQQTGQDGRVRLSVPPGAWTLLAAGPPGALTTQSLAVPGGPFNLTLPDAARLAVRVNALATTDTIATLRLAGGDGRAFENLSIGGALEREWPVIGGKAVIDGVPAGRWIVQVASADGRAWTGTVATDGIQDAAVALD